MPDKKNLRNGLKKYQDFVNGQISSIITPVIEMAVEYFHFNYFIEQFSLFKNYVIII